MAILTPFKHRFCDITATLNGAIDMEFNVPIVVPATADIKITCISDTGGAGAICTGHFSGWLENA